MLLSFLSSVFATALIGRVVGDCFQKVIPFIYSFLLFFGFLFFVQQTSILKIPTIIEYGTWSSYFNINFSLALDGLSLIFCLLITGIGLGVFLYASSYMQDYKKTTGFYSTLLVFTGSMLGLVLSNNLILLFIFWEMTSLTSYLLVGFKSYKKEVRKSARWALFVTVGGGLFLLLGIVLLSIMGQDAGLSSQDSLILSQLVNINILDHSLVVPTILCFAVAIASKSAQMPLHFWLPLAMAGPTPVSSFLHSATMVKAGIFLLMRLFPILGGSPVWQQVFIPMGAITMILGALLAISQEDIKKILAYTTISVLGILTLLMGIGTVYAIKAAVVYIVAHAFYKAALFQIVGNLDYATGSRDIKSLSNLKKFMPLSALAALLSSFSMAGFPPFFGFFGKELAYFSKLKIDDYGLILMILALIANILMTALAFGICFRPFWKSKTNPDTKPKRSLPILMSLTPLGFAILGTFIGLFPHFFDQYLGSPAASIISGTPIIMSLKLWHGFNTPALIVVGVSALTISLGIFVTFKLRFLIRIFSSFFHLYLPFSVKDLADKALEGILKAAKLITIKIQNGNLSSYLRTTLGSIVLLLILSHYKVFNTQINFTFNLFESFACLSIICPAIACLFVKGRLSQITLMATSGLGLVLTFSIFSAVDVGMTQLMVESLSIIFVLYLIKTSRRDKIEGEHFYFSNLIIPIIFSLIIGYLTLVDKAELPMLASQYFIENSYVKAFGKNIVNVILVDFRALDTFGEVVVVCIAFIGVAALLLKNKKGAK